ncbi:serine/threonine-protein phosphatase 7 long form [Cinnamomum micranthum f. kanehirae]|uniref:Serine/threonine-protein phosphatase 7 long form n=1 Tax=Cinnamomum micranthum f. kanehirae TaxID=337451 RepID=A0A443PJF8_9MAGN|nr:serine/threonine-protein phosphatase 7 long form [Cinnamomum micranthum f. kanehirae]
MTVSLKQVDRVVRAYVFYRLEDVSGILCISEESKGQEMTSKMILMAEFNPGPLDRCILQEQDDHISEVIWSGRRDGGPRQTLSIWLVEKQKITLEDVAYIYGLPINGRVVTGRTFSSPTTVSESCWVNILNKAGIAMVVT